jgi:dihydroorotate dehydrogenase
MITFPDGRTAEYFIASGALAFDGKGWWWERILVRLGLIKPELFVVTTKSLSLKPIKGNLRWWKPWDCVRLILGGAVNKVGLTNKGIDWWLRKVAPTIDFRKYRIIISLYGTEEEVIIMMKKCEHLDIVGFEINWSCPNTGHASEKTAYIIKGTKAVRNEMKNEEQCLFVKISADQDGVTIARELLGVVTAITFNTLAWDKVFPGKRSPLHRLEKRVGGGGGAVSGKPLQKHNWSFMHQIHKAVPAMNLVASSIMEYNDMREVRVYGASGVSFGTINLPDYYWWLKPWTIFTNPCKPTRFVKREQQERWRIWDEETEKEAYEV